ncbi:MAG: pantoate--beta-alanine ligase [Alphaproteobacteria bacterium]|nr:pantoate--beta-alanine ligase [Alphaproteobacteria bacterium]
MRAAPVRGGDCNRRLPARLRPGPPVSAPGLAVVRSVAELRRRVAAWRAAGDTIGLVPTMGALHAGHLALVAAARERCRRTVVSIFVNPKQFGPCEDFATYPRPETADFAKLSATSAELAFMPSIDEMYPEGFSTAINVSGIGEGLCDAHRPGHFDGVATVVAKLLIQTAPDAAFFGEKDYQQLMVVRRMARDLDLPVEIVGVPTVREPDGLALSSRNAYLSADERRLAPHLHRALREAAADIAGGAAPAPVLERAVFALTDRGLRVEYLELRDAATLAPVASRAARPARLLAAVHLGRTRLIDNLPVPPPGPSRS